MNAPEEPVVGANGAFPLGADTGAAPAPGSGVRPFGLRFAEPPPAEVELSDRPCDEDTGSARDEDTAEG